jgi:hypothetical protein
METIKRKKRRIRISAEAGIFGIYILLLLACYVYTGGFFEAIGASLVLLIPTSILSALIATIFGL